MCIIHVNTHCKGSFVRKFITRNIVTQKLCDLQYMYLNMHERAESYTQGVTFLIDTKLASVRH